MPAISTNTDHDLKLPLPAMVKQKYNYKGFRGSGVAHPINIPVIGMNAPSVLALQFSEQGAGQVHMFRQEDSMT